ncbi:MAG: acylphosphatase [Deltaproteobacteria bacterium]|nr:acylphosphatase [Deltaproteobacteria bacterium]
MKMARAHIIVSGIVQGVFYRATTTEVARRHNVCGWVKNNPGGTVEAVLEGAENDVRDVIEWCRTGPAGARVDGVKVAWEGFKGEFDDFRAITRYSSY